MQLKFIIHKIKGLIFYSNNILDSWEQVIFNERNQGYNTLQFYTCDISDIQNNSLFWELQENGTLIYTIDDEENLDIGDMVTGGDGAFCFYDIDSPLLITSTYYNAWYFINTEENSYNYVNNKKSDRTCL